MLSLSTSRSFSCNSMVNTPVISPSTLKDDPFRTALSNTMQTPDVIDFSLAFAPMTTSAAAVPTTPATTTSHTLYLAGTQSQPVTSTINLASLQPTFTSSISLFPNASDSEHDNILLDLSPRIRNQITRPPAFPQNASSASLSALSALSVSSSVPSMTSSYSSAPFIASTSSGAAQVSMSAQAQAQAPSSYNTYHSQYAESLQISPEFLYPASVEPTRRPTHRNVTSTVSRPTDTPVTSYDFNLTHREEMLSSDSNTVDYFRETGDTNALQHFGQQTRSPSPEPMAGTSSMPLFSYMSDDSQTDRYLSLRVRNNKASKKFRSSKRDQQKEMEKQIQYYLEDNKRCHKLIAQMEKEIEQCKQILFRNFRRPNN